MNGVYVVVPDGFDDPERPSGGNVYDRRICRGLESLGWSVRIRAVAGGWPDPDPAALSALANTLAALPDGATVLLDGLIASTVPDVLVPEAKRLRQVVLVHMPLESAPEREVLEAATAVITTSEWTRTRLLDRYELPTERLHVAPPGVDAAEPAAGTAAGGNLLCVAAVAPHKGQDVLLAALGRIPDLPWRCVFAGPVDHEFSDRLRYAAIADRVRFTGPLAGTDLDRAYGAADALVLASHAETYGMVVTEALARGLPVIATRVGGIPEALGDGPGLLVPPGDPAAFAAAVRRWLVDAELRQRLRTAARRRRTQLADWSATARRIGHVLRQVAT